MAGARAAGILTPAETLDLGDPASFAALLDAAGWLLEGERVMAVASAGAGNMNLVARVRTTLRSLIVKAARPWVERFPAIPAPVARAGVERAFYRAVAADPVLAAKMPAWMGGAGDVNLFEDLAPLGASDFTDLYAGAAIDAGDLAALVAFLARLHALPVAAPGDFANRELRALNHTHVFVLPFAQLPELRDRAAALGARYLADGPHLLHGDFFPGSWLRIAHGPRVIDPEFAFMGPREWDLGILAAHLAIAGLPDPLATCRGPVDAALVRAFAGVEIVRRLLGVATLPLGPQIDQAALLERGKAWLA